VLHLSNTIIVLPVVHGKLNGTERAISLDDVLVSTEQSCKLEDFTYSDGTSEVTSSNCHSLLRIVSSRQLDTLELADESLTRN
jgi:hypothetical protein